MRPTREATWIEVAHTISKQTTCVRRQVGCVLLDVGWHVLSTGYNGTPQGTPHCIEVPCAGAIAKTGTKLELCEAVHAEANALLQCPNTQEIYYCVVTAFPCVHCLKLLMNTTCRGIIYQEPYGTNMADLVDRFLDSSISRFITRVNSNGEIQKKERLSYNPPLYASLGMGTPGSEQSPGP